MPIRYRIYHVAPDPANPVGGWRVKGQNAERASSKHVTKEEAVERGRALARARKGQLIVHREDGTFQVEYTYGHDPASSPG